MKPLTTLGPALAAAGYAVPGIWTIRRWIASGRIPVIVCRFNRYFWNPEDLDQIAASLMLVRERPAA